MISLKVFKETGNVIKAQLKIKQQSCLQYNYERPDSWAAHQGFTYTNRRLLVVEIIGLLTKFTTICAE